MNTPVQTSEPAAVPSPAPPVPLRAGRRKYRLFKRGDNGDPAFRDRPYYFRFACHGKRYQRCLETNDAVEAQRRARLKAQEIKDALARSDYKRLERTKLRQTIVHTVGQVLDCYPHFVGPDRPEPSTLRLNVHALRQLLRETGAESDAAQDRLPLTHLTSQLVWRWQESKRQLAAAVVDDDERAQQILRTANSRLRQARSVFAGNADPQNFYLHHNIVLPDNIPAFRTAAPFGNVDKHEYHTPSDQVIVSTFAALEKLCVPSVPSAPCTPEALNMYKAIWLAIGFGLRKSEISVARRDWFHQVDGVVYCRGNVLAKNGKYPEIRAQLGAWSRIEPLVRDLAPDSYMLAGTATERREDTFRRISEWMRHLGWETQHHVHEFRAWAGCQIAMAVGGRGMLDAMVFMRHASYSTTEKYYGHHLKLKLREVQLTLPSVTPCFS
jgi:integrase